MIISNEFKVARPQTIKSKKIMFEGEYSGQLTFRWADSEKNSIRKLDGGKIAGRGATLLSFFFF